VALNCLKATQRTSSTIPSNNQAANHTVIAQLENIVSEKFSIHPFQNGISKENIEPVMARYLAMSLAFPYLQAAASKPKSTDLKVTIKLFNS
jgi:hypothetical protein